jgi:hypothetical protein
VGSVKRCKNPKCNKIFYPDWNEKNVVYCVDCRKKDIKKEEYDDRHPNRKLGNPKQDKEIMSFLKKKRTDADKTHGLCY